jgi:hypothetical protein
MKKIILSAIVLFTVGFVNAQKAEFGLKGGLNSSTFSGDTDGMNLKSKIGFNIGAFAAIKLSDKITLQPELLYSTQGVKAENVSGLVGDIMYTGDVKFNLSYLNVPIMMKYYVAENFYLETGPQIGFLTSAKTSTKIDGYSQTSEQDVKDYFESVDFGLNFGAALDFSKKVSAGIRYNLGLSNIFKTQPGDNSKTQNSVFSLSLAYKL